MKKPTFEHRHYKAIAQIIAALGDEERAVVAAHFARHLESTNPNFDFNRFLDAANGYPSNWRDCT